MLDCGFDREEPKILERFYKYIPFSLRKPLDRLSSVCYYQNLDWTSRKVK